MPWIGGRYVPTPPEDVRERYSPEDLRGMARDAAEMRYGEAQRQIPAMGQRMQRVGLEAEAKRGTAGTGVADRRTTMPLAQQQTRMADELAREKGQFKQTFFDELRMAERARADELLAQEYQDWVAKQQLGLQHGQLDVQRGQLGIQAFQAMAPYKYLTQAQLQQLPLSWAQTMYEMPGSLDDLPRFTGEINIPNFGTAMSPSGAQNYSVRAAQSYVQDKGGRVSVDRRGNYDVVIVNGYEIDPAVFGGSIPQYILDRALSLPRR